MQGTSLSLAFRKNNDISHFQYPESSYKYQIESNFNKTNTIRNIKLLLLLATINPISIYTMHLRAVTLAGG